MCKAMYMSFLDYMSALQECHWAAVTILGGCTHEEALEKNIRCIQVRNIFQMSNVGAVSKRVSEQGVRSKLLKINVKTATGCDITPPKILKIDPCTYYQGHTLIFKH